MPGLGGEDYFALGTRMTALALASVVFEATAVGPLSAQMRHRLPRPGMSA
jgi:hypothetical protein